jgi:hypothetical protein
MQLTPSSREALNSFLAQLVEGHIRYYMTDANRRPASKESGAALELIDVVKNDVKRETESSKPATASRAPAMACSRSGWPALSPRSRRASGPGAVGQFHSSPKTTPKDVRFHEGDDASHQAVSWHKP